MSSITQPPSARATAAINAATEEARLAAAGRSDSIAGPRAIGVPLERFAALVWTIAVSQFKLKFYGSALGYVWQLMRPLLMFGVLYMFFTRILRFPEVQYYPVVLLQGIVVFTFLSEATVGSVGALVENEILVRKIQFPRLAVPFSIVLSALFNLLINYVVVLIFLIIQGGSPQWTWLYEFPILLVLLVILATAISTLLSALFVRYRDIRPIWEVLLQTIYFISLVLIPVESITDPTLRKVLLINPFACIVEQLRYAVISNTAPTVLEVFGNAWLITIPIAIGIALCVTSFIVFDRMAPKVAEEL